MRLNGPAALTRPRAKAAEVDGRAIHLQGALTETEGRHRRISTMVEDGIGEAFGRKDARPHTSADIPLRKACFQSIINDDRSR